MKVVTTEAMPICDICKAEDCEIIYDIPYRGSSWANCCEDCRKGSTAPNYEGGTKFVKGSKPESPERTLAEIIAMEEKHVRSLSDEDMATMMRDSVLEAADGCSVEPDGKCPHGFRSPLLVRGVI
jgi:hypothetical protein